MLANCTMEIGNVVNARTASSVPGGQSGANLTNRVPSAFFHPDKPEARSEVPVAEERVHVLGKKDVVEFHVYLT
jgi:hypothetical protein